MTWYWNFNTVLKIIVYCIFLHSVSLGYVTSLSSDTGGNGNEDPLSIRINHGNTHIHCLSSSSTYELRIDLTNTNNYKKYAKYKTLVVGDSASQYKLTIGSYSGNAGDSLTYSDGKKFSTFDRDNDLHSNNCAKSYGPWWFDSCSHSALNGGSKTNWYWNHISGNFVTTSVMMIRKV